MSDNSNWSPCVNRPPYPRPYGRLPLVGIDTTANLTSRCGYGGPSCRDSVTRHRWRHRHSRNSQVRNDFFLLNNNVHYFLCDLESNCYELQIERKYKKVWVYGKFSGRGRLYWSILISLSVSLMKLYFITVCMIHYSYNLLQRESRLFEGSIHEFIIFELELMKYLNRYQLIE